LRASLHYIVDVVAAAVSVSSIRVAVPREVGPPLNHLRREHLFYVFKWYIFDGLKVEEKNANAGK